MQMVKYFSRFVFTCTKNSVLSLTLLNQTTQCHWYPGGKLLPDIDNTESDSTLSLIPRSQASQWHWQHWIRLSSVIDTPESSFSIMYIDNAESDSAVSLIPRSQASQWHWQRWIRLRSGIDTPESSFSMTLTTQVKYAVLYLVFFSNLKRHHIILYTFYVSTVTQLDPIFKG